MGDRSTSALQPAQRWLGALTLVLFLFTSSGLVQTLCGFAALLEGSHQVAFARHDSDLDLVIRHARAGQARSCAHTTPKLTHPLAAVVLLADHNEHADHVLHFKTWHGAASLEGQHRIAAPEHQALLLPPAPEAPATNFAAVVLTVSPPTAPPQLTQLRRVVLLI